MQELCVEAKREFPEASWFVGWVENGEELLWVSGQGGFSEVGQGIRKWRGEFPVSRAPYAKTRWAWHTSGAELTVWPECWWKVVAPGGWSDLQVPSHPEALGKLWISSCAPERVKIRSGETAQSSRWRMLVARAVLLAVGWRKRMDWDLRVRTGSSCWKEVFFILQFRIHLGKVLIVQAFLSVLKRCFKHRQPKIYDQDFPLKGLMMS